MPRLTPDRRPPPSRARPAHLHSVLQPPCAVARHTFAGRISVPSHLALFTRSAEDREIERQVEGVVTSVEDHDVDRGRTGAARIEVVVPGNTTSVLSRRREVDAVRDVGL